MLNHSDDLMVLSAMGTAAVIRLPDCNATEYLQDYIDTTGNLFILIFYSFMLL